MVGQRPKVCVDTPRDVWPSEFALDQPESVRLHPSCGTFLGQTLVHTPDKRKSVRWFVGLKQAYLISCFSFDRVDTSDAKVTAYLHSTFATDAMHRLLSTSKDAMLLSVRMANGKPY